MRKMAYVVKIDDVAKHPNADKLDICTVGGWKVITQRGEYKIGDMAIYAECDAWIPTELAPFLSKGREPREYNGVKGERLRTVRLRGELSQGLLLPLFFSYSENAWCFSPTWHYLPIKLNEGDDVSERLNIQKYEPPVPAQLSGVVKGNFPSYVPKTDEERLQNLKKEFEEWKQRGMHWSVSEKLEGSSLTVSLNHNDDVDKQFQVCSRNLSLKQDENNSFWKVVLKYDLERKLREIGLNIAIQAELVGPGVQGNIYGLSEVDLYVFDIFNIDTQEYLTAESMIAISKDLGLKTVPIVGNTMIDANESIFDMILKADGKSMLANTNREGLVFKCIESPDISFKIISNAYLEKGQ